MATKMNDHVLAIDIGGSKYMVGIVDLNGNIIESRRYKWEELTSKTVVQSIIKSSRELLEEHRDISLDSIGVTIPGLADPRGGIWIESSFSGIKNINIGEILQKEFGLPVYIDNDAQACALAEKLFGVCKENKDFLYMTISNGIGGAVFANNSLYYGGFGNAGEIGHCVVVENGFQCKCGNKGCLEVYAAGPAIVRNFIELGGDTNSREITIDAKYISELAYKGDEIAIKTFELVGKYVGKVIGTICNVLNPQKVIIGGGVSLSFSLFEQSLKDTIKDYIYISANKGLVIEPSPFGYNGGLLGAAGIAICGKDHRYNWGNINN